MALAKQPVGPSLEEFGDLVQRLRSERGLSADALAERAMLSPATLEEIELGQRAARLDELFALAEGFGIAVSTMFRVWENEHGDARAPGT